MKDLKSFLKQKINEGRITSYSLSVFKKGEEIVAFSDGFSVINPLKIKAKDNTLYDIASITKTVATSFLVGLLFQEGALNLNSPLKSFFINLPENKREITVLQLLTHSSGIISWKPLYYNKTGFDNILREALIAEIETKPGTSVIYSCINYIILKAIIEKVSGKSYENLFYSLIRDKLNLKETYFSPPEKLKKRISATEKGNEYERVKSEKFFGLKIPARKGITWGKVHDGNSFFSGGTAGNSGLFSTAKEIGMLGNQLLESISTLFKPETIKLFFKNFTPFGKTHRSIGLILKTSEGAVLSPDFPEKSGYHNGFTGTSLAVVPEKELVISFLSNRVHPFVREPMPKDIFNFVHTYIYRNINV